MSLTEQLRSRLRGKVVVVGVGNSLRGDDGAGSEVALRLLDGGVEAIDASEVPENVVGLVAAASPDTVVLVDAVDMGAEPGAVALIERGRSREYLATTHRAPLDLVMTYLSHETGADVFLLGIQPQHVRFGIGLSGEVAAGVTSLVALLSAMLRATSRRATQGTRPAEEVG